MTIKKSHHPHPPKKTPKLEILLNSSVRVEEPGKLTDKKLISLVI